MIEMCWYNVASASGCCL